LDHNYNQGLQIDRINNDGPYSPWNCRWVTTQQNALNKRNTRRVLYQQRWLNLRELSSCIGISYSVLCSRYDRAEDKQSILDDYGPTEYTFNGLTGTLRDWSEYLGIGTGTLWWRLNQGWSIERTFTQSTRGGV
jgi:hypothetical protein